MSSVNIKIEELSPGPGAYNSISSFASCGGAMSKSQRFNCKKESFPGPGAYNLVLPQSKASSVISKSARGELFKCAEAPGPGNYEVSSRVSGPSFSFKGKVPEKLLQTPGPGAYSPRLVESRPKTAVTTKAKRPELVKVIDNPGPGQYESLSSFRDGPSWSIHGASNPILDNSVPGPGKYDPSLPVNTVSYGTSKASRPELFPAPSSPIPGPGRYEAPDIKSPKIGYSIGKSTRKSVVSSTPGPGKYNPTLHSKSISMKFGTQPKKTLEFGNDNPSANLYTPQLLKKSPSYTFGSKIEKKFDNGVPGPGSYSAEKTKEVVNVKIGKTIRFVPSFIEKEEMEKPGPGNYEVIKKDKPKMFISQSSRQLHKVNDTPGPGQYNPIKA